MLDHDEDVEAALEDGVDVVAVAANHDQDSADGARRSGTRLLVSLNDKPLSPSRRIR